MKRFDFKVLKFDAATLLGAGKVDEVGIEAVLNEHGQAGWELISTLHATASGNSTFYVYNLQRQIQ